MKQPVTTDEHGRVIGFAYHDGYLEGVLMAERGTTVRLLLRSTDNTLNQLTLHRVLAFNMDGCREANIVLGIRLLPADVAWSHPRTGDALKSRLFLDPSSTTGLQVLVLDSSFGAEITAVCESIEVELVDEKE